MEIAEKNKIKTIKEVKRADLLGIFENRSLLLNIPDFFDENTCSSLTKKIHNNMILGFYENAPKIGRIGKAFYETIASKKTQNEYFESSQQWIFELRRCCFPLISPIDSLRVYLDDIWPYGSTLASVNGKKMFVGLARYFTSEASAEPHQDIIQRDAPDTDISKIVKRQIAANVYLNVPNQGGELEIWNWAASDEEFKNLKDKRPDFLYAFDRNLIRSSDVKLKPSIGSLVLFNSNNVHAVTPSSDDRLSISCFIGYCGQNKPLLLWS